MIWDDLVTNENLQWSFSRVYRSLVKISSLPGVNGPESATEKEISSFLKSSSLSSWSLEWNKGVITEFEREFISTEFREGAVFRTKTISSNLLIEYFIINHSWSSSTNWKLHLPWSLNQANVSSAHPVLFVVTYSDKILDRLSQRKTITSILKFMELKLDSLEDLNNYCEDQINFMILMIVLP